MIKILFAAFFLISSSAIAESQTVFKGIPSIKISEAGASRKPEKLKRKEAVNLSCVISKIGNDYYWASRENTPLTRTESGSFITYTASNGSGYIRVIKSGGKKTASLMSETEKKFDYVEHLLLGLRTITYFGVKY